MAKSVLKKKKVNRRLKKSVRRTIGALCMITAIIVAAIPFPDAAANPDENEITPASLEETLPYSYDTDVVPKYSSEDINGDFVEITDTTNGFDLSMKYKESTDPNIIKNISMAHTISAGGGAWELDWQYKYYKNSSGVCLITEYNDLYPQDTITLDANVYSNYINIPQSEYENILSDADTATVQIYAGDSPIPGLTKTIDTLGKKYTMEGNPYKTPDEAQAVGETGCKGTEGYNFIRQYFENDFNAYLAKYDEYLANLAKNDGGIYQEPLSITKTNGDRFPDKLQYVCDAVFDDTSVDMKLEIVYKKVYADDGKSLLRTEQVRVPRLLTQPEDGKSVVEVGSRAYRVDKNGFLAQDYASLVGVASGAFTDIQKVKTLEMSERVYIIADSAFEHSFLESITLSRDSKIGNRAFYNCPSLQTVNMPETGITAIGTEAFALTVISSINIPGTVMQIGAGAFANCKYLKTVNFVGTNAGSNREIGKYAFYNCTALNEINFGDAGISKIGKCAFALEDTPTGNLQNINMPDDISDANEIGDYLFGRRVNLISVTMPKNLNLNKLPSHMFYDCVGLANVIFPDEAQGVTYDSAMFKDVMNENFYVRGPKSTYAGASPGPRVSTWTAYFLNDSKKHVPYVYNDAGKDFYEVNIGSYICVIDELGEIVSCKKAEGASADTVFSIPASVGDRTVTGIKEGALGTVESVDSVIKTMTELKVADGCEIVSVGDNVFKGAPELLKVTLGDSVQTIGAYAFANCEKLKLVQIGSSVTAIGEGAFENCVKLIEISFDNPVGGESSFPLENIGANAFSTKSPNLTIYGLINGSYGPFAWAMQPDNYMNPNNGLRVCYKSAKEDPQGMTVILDNSNNLPTLVDYPKFSNIDDDILRKYDSSLFDDEAISDGSDGLTGLTPEESAIINAAINVVVPDGVKSIDSAGYFSSSSKKTESTLAGVYNKNDNNIATYFKEIQSENSGGLFSSNSSAYGSSLNNEYKDDTLEQKAYEKNDSGNDRLESISLKSVEYLPDNAFYSCERLGIVDLGSAMSDVGVLPFKGCENITSIACENDKYAYSNGMLYENLDNGTKKIIECLASRGNVVGTGVVSTANDDIANVTEIAEAAFSECPYIQQVDFTGASLLEEIPDECFKGSEKLTKVILPENVVEVGDRAFADTGAYTEAWIYSSAASLGDNLMQDVGQGYLYTYPNTATSRQADDEAEKNTNVTVMEIPADGSCIVNFFVESEDEDGKITYVNFYQYVAEKTGKNYADLQVVVSAGSSVKKLAPTIEELEEYGFIPDGYEFTRWMGQISLDNITDSCDFYAVFSPKGSDGNSDPDSPGGNTPGGDTPGGNTPGGNTPGGNTPGTNTPNGNKDDDDDDKDSKKYTLTVVYGNGSGVYKSGSTVIISAIEPPAGKEFYKWESNNSGVTITSATSAATTVKTTSSDATVTATYRNKSTVSGNSTVNRKPIGSSSTSVQINKPGISNTDKAYASVSGSTDNFIVKITESSEAANAVATALSNKYSDMNPIKYFAMDISLYDKNGNKVTNTNGLSVNITMPIPDALVQYGGNNRVGAVNGNTLEDLGCKFTTVDGIPCVTFTATHFSPYTIYVDTSNLSVNTLDSTPKTGDGIHPKWFVSIALACISLILFMKKDKVVLPKKVTI